MAEQILTLSFAYHEGSTEQRKGISFKTLIAVLQGLSDALGLSAEQDDFRLHDIVDNAHSLLFLSNNTGLTDKFKHLHDKIKAESKNLLSSKEIAYYESLAHFTENNVSVTATAIDDNWKTEISHLATQVPAAHYFETDEIVGTITKIGSDTLASDSFIKLDNFPFKIRINRDQESQLKSVFKEGRIAAVSTDQEATQQDGRLYYSLY